MIVAYEVRIIDRNTWAVMRVTDGTRTTVFVTTDELSARRVRDELARADRRAFYEGVLAAGAA